MFFFKKKKIKKTFSKVVFSGKFDVKRLRGKTKLAKNKYYIYIYEEFLFTRIAILPIISIVIYGCTRISYACR